MDALDLLFAALNYSVLPAWLLLLLAPRWRWTERIVHAAFVPALLAIAYGIVLFTDSPGPQGAHFWTLDGVMRIFTSRQTVIACWVHYLVLDLFVGSWIARDAERLSIAHAWVAPILVLTLMFGPLGLLAYIALRAVLRRRTTLVEQASSSSVGAPPLRATSSRPSADLHSRSE
jgi:hypothetical protein